MAEDPREAAERYRFEKWQREQGLEPEKDSEPGDGPQRAPTSAERAAFVEVSIQQAMRRGEFDQLPGAGKPLEGLGESHDPDWWIRRKIEREQLRGLGPPALMLRVEHAELEERLDALTREDEVREYIEDFNRRVDRGAPPAPGRPAGRDADAGCRRRGAGVARAAGGAITRGR